MYSLPPVQTSSTASYSPSASQPAENSGRRSREIAGSSLSLLCQPCQKIQTYISLSCLLGSHTRSASWNSILLDKFVLGGLPVYEHIENNKLCIFVIIQLTLEVRWRNFKTPFKNTVYTLLPIQYIFMNCSNSCIRKFVWAILLITINYHYYNYITIWYSSYVFFICAQTAPGPVLLKAGKCLFVCMTDFANVFRFISMQWTIFLLFISESILWFRSYHKF